MQGLQGHHIFFFVITLVKTDWATETDRQTDRQTDRHIHTRDQTESPVTTHQVHQEEGR